MSDYSVTSYNPNNINDTLYAYQSNRVVATNPIPQATKTSYVSGISLDTPPDTFELSAESKIKKNKEKGMSTGLKWLLGIGGTAAVYGVVVGHRALNKPTLEKVAQNFSEIFRKDISKEEAEKLVNKYKDIFKEKDKDKFIQKCFAQAKEDFGYKNLDITIGKLSQTEISKSAQEGYALGGGYRPLGVIWENTADSGTNMILNNTVIKVNPNLSKQELFEKIIHELTHLKQHEIAYRGNKEGLFEAIKEARFSALKNKSWYNKITSEYLNEFERLYGGTWDKLPKIKKDSKEYELAQKYIEDIKHYTGGGKTKQEHNRYMEQLVEQEAHGAEPKAQEIFNYFGNIWRVF